MESTRRLEGRKIRRLIAYDMPYLAMAILDYRSGLNTFRMEKLGSLNIFRFLRPGSYDLPIKEVDWKKIFPLIRYSTGSLNFKQPEPRVFTQPNREPAPRPTNPGAGLTSYMEGFSEPVEKTILDAISMAGKSLTSALDYSKLNPGSIDPMSWCKDLTVSDRETYLNLVGALLTVFPR